MSAKRQRLNTNRGQVPKKEPFDDWALLLEPSQLMKCLRRIVASYVGLLMQDSHEWPKFAPCAVAIDSQNHLHMVGKGPYTYQITNLQGEILDLRHLKGAESISITGHGSVAVGQVSGGGGAMCRLDARGVWKRISHYAPTVNIAISDDNKVFGTINIVETDTFFRSYVWSCSINPSQEEAKLQAYRWPEDTFNNGTFLSLVCGGQEVFVAEPCMRIP